MTSVKALKFWVPALISLVVFASPGYFAQDQEEEGVRGSFLTSRPAPAKPRPTPTQPRRSQRTRQKATDPDTGSTTQHPGFTDSGAADPASSVKNPNPGGPIGLGYSLYLRDSNGDPVRVDPSREFHYKDALRVSLEANTRGFLYVFYTEDDGHPQMLFPDARLIQGTNRIEAHVPYEVPSSHEADPSRRWFVFDEKPALERLYIVITRQPLPMVPVGDELLAYCKGRANCTWQPPESVWSIVRDGLNAKVKVSKSDSVGQAQTQTERDATIRGIGLDTTAPAPTVVRMNVSSNAPVLITTVELVHK
jgi:hypothetical protein